MVLRLSRRLAQTVDDMQGCGQIGVSDAQADYIYALRLFLCYFF
jgi:hypothetical protein